MVTPSKDPRFKWEESLGVSRWICMILNEIERQPKVELPEHKPVKLQIELSKPRAEKLGVYNYRHVYLDTCECHNDVTCALCVQRNLKAIQDELGSK